MMVSLSVVGHICDWCPAAAAAETAEGGKKVLRRLPSKLQRFNAHLLNTLEPSNSPGKQCTKHANVMVA